MTVVTHADEFFVRASKNRRCNICGGPLFYPFVEWVGDDTQLFICRQCCRSCRKGLMADMTEAATMDVDQALADFREALEHLRK